MVLSAGPCAAQRAASIPSPRAEQQENQKRENQNGDHCTDAERESAGEQPTDLVDHESSCICKHCLVTDGEPSPFCTRHFTANRADCSKARSTQQVKDEEGERRSPVAVSYTHLLTFFLSVPLGYSVLRELREGSLPGTPAN